MIAWAHGTAGVGPNCAPSGSPNLYLRPPSSGFTFFYVGAAYASYVAASARLFAPSLQYTDLLSGQLAAEMPTAKGLCLIDLAVHLQKLHPPLERIFNPSRASHPQLRQFFSPAVFARPAVYAPCRELTGAIAEGVPQVFVHDRVRRLALLYQLRASVLPSTLTAGAVARYGWPLKPGLPRIACGRGRVPAGRRKLESCPVGRRGSRRDSAPVARPRWTTRPYRCPRPSAGYWSSASRGGIWSVSSGDGASPGKGAAPECHTSFSET